MLAIPKECQYPGVQQAMMAMTLDEDTGDVELARNAAGGDRASFTTLVERHYGFIFRP